MGDTLVRLFVVKRERNNQDFGTQVIRNILKENARTNRFGIVSSIYTSRRSVSQCYNENYNDRLVSGTLLSILGQNSPALCISFSHESCSLLFTVLKN